MNYYIEGNAAKAEQIKAAFKKLGYDTGNLGFTSSQLYYTIEGKVELMCTKSLQNLVKTHPDYKELELPIEPKFKVGDWVVKKSGYTFYGGNYVEQITLIDVDEDGERIWLSSTTWVDNKDIRLWTIQDAKDGDILISRAGNPFIYNGNIEFSAVGAYVGISYNGKIVLDMFPSRTWTNIKDIKPATKEQRDLLFKKMQEAGCEWDEKKKELRKIIEPKFKVGDKVLDDMMIVTVREVVYDQNYKEYKYGIGSYWVFESTLKPYKSHYNIANLQPKQWVLVRDDNEWEWALTRFSHLSNGSASLFVCINGASFQQCIPFEGNEKLLGTTDMPSEEFINW